MTLEEYKKRFCVYCWHYEAMRIKAQDGYEIAQYGKCLKHSTITGGVLTPCDCYCDDWEER